MEDLDQAIAHYLLDHIGSHGVLRTQFVKLMYLADVVSVSTYGRRATTLPWIRYDHGPLAFGIYDIEKQLDASGCARTQERMSASGKKYTVIRPTDNDAPALPPDVQIVANKVLADYGHLSLSELLKTAYSTKPMQRAEHGDMLNFTALVPDEPMKDEDETWLFSGLPWGE